MNCHLVCDINTDLEIRVNVSILNQQRNYYACPGIVFHVADPSVQFTHTKPAGSCGMTYQKEQYNIQLVLSLLYVRSLRFHVTYEVQFDECLGQWGQFVKKEKKKINLWECYHGNVN